MSPASDHPSILCVGRVYCDVIFTDLPRMPTSGTEVFAGGLGVHAGGGAAITAGHLSALGHRTALAAQLPGNGFGDVVIRELRGFGIDLDLCGDQGACHDPQLTVALVHNGERAFVTHRAGAAFPEFSAQDLRHNPPAHIHVGEATTLVDNPGLIKIARDLGATLSLDCSWDDELDGKKIAHLLPQIDVFLPNEAEVQLLRELGVSEPFCRLTAIKQGKLGATAVIEGAEIKAPALPAKVVDTTGAGDAFNAAFLSAWLGKRPVEACLQAGNKRGAEAVSYRGGLGGVSEAINIV